MNIHMLSLEHLFICYNVLLNELHEVDYIFNKINKICVCIIFI